jgi:hypothetical protein
MPDFTATVQHGNWDGTAAADDAHSSIRAYLQERQLMKEEELLIATSITVLEGSASLSAFVFAGSTPSKSIHAVIANTRGPIPVRKIDLPLSLEEFVKLFNRFSVVLTGSNIGLEGREYRTVDPPEAVSPVITG